MLLWWEVVFKEVSSLRFFQVLQALLTAPNLDSIAAVFLLSLDLSDLASVDLDNSAWYELTPLVPKMSHSDLVSDQASSLAFTILRGCLLNLVLAVDLIFKWHICFSLVWQTMSVRSGKRAVVKNLGLLQILEANLMQLRNGSVINLWGCRCKEAEWLWHEHRLQNDAWASSEDSFTYDLR